MAKSPNGKIVKSLYLKIAYVWTRPKPTIREKTFLLVFVWLNTEGKAQLY